MENNDECAMCGESGEVLCCDYCPKVYHLKCVGLKQNEIPKGKWRCSSSHRAPEKRKRSPSVSDFEESINPSSSDTDLEEVIESTQVSRPPSPIAPPSEGDEDDGEWLRYFCEYAKNNRAKCKSCFEKLFKGDIRIGVSILHTKFGRTTYYKHLECTMLCIEIPEAGPEYDIAGINDLKLEDQNTVKEWISKSYEDHQTKQNAKLQRKNEIIPTVAQSSQLTRPLLPYQNESLAWMLQQEASLIRGGILADEMGMGKTIQAISLILNRLESSSSTQTSQPRPGTLIICPVVAVLQWRDEIKKFTTEGSVSVLIYHGQKRHSLRHLLSLYDVVLTTYSIVEYEYREEAGHSKVKCKYCGRKFRPDRLPVHQRYFCGPLAQRTQNQKKTEKKKAGKRFGKAQLSLPDDEDYDDADNDNGEDDCDDSTVKPQRNPSPLHELTWTRIILDEAHHIKDRGCNTARSIFALKGAYRWCLTGTPLQNRVSDLYSLVRFLQLKPDAYYFCKSCTCESMDYEFKSGKCDSCGHSAMAHYSYFNRNYVNSIVGYGLIAEGRLAMDALRVNVLDKILLRRTKLGRASDITLPPKLVNVRRDTLDEREEDFYQGTLLNNYAHIFDLLMRLRQAVDHPYLVIHSQSARRHQDNIQLRETTTVPTLNGQMDHLEERLCSICRENSEDQVTSQCGHDFCRSCATELISSISSSDTVSCPVCEEPLTIDLEASSKKTKSVVHKNILSRLGDEQQSFQSSTKIEALMEELTLMQLEDPSAKAIVFSQFVNMLDLIEHRLRLGDVKCVKLAGSMSMQRRDVSIKSFTDDPAIRVFLISLKAGGVALNLTVASRIFLMDPWWNPAAEQQAIDRAHRLGQFKPIQATRFIIANTIEERILKLQEKKQLIFESTLGKGDAGLSRLSEEDLRFLFCS